MAPAVSRARIFANIAWVLIAALAPSIAHAQSSAARSSGGHEQVLTPVAVDNSPASSAPTNYGAPYNLRPMVATHELDVNIGFGYGVNPEPFGAPIGVALNAFLGYGVAHGLLIGLGVGLRAGQPGATSSDADRYARVNEEWLPGDHLGAGDASIVPGSSPSGDRAEGNEVVSNPYFRLRYAPANTGHVMLGFEIFMNAPIFFASSCWTPGVGIPLHIRFGRFRIETGYFQEMLLGGVCTATMGSSASLGATYVPGVADFLTYVPLRFNVQVTDRFWFGLRTGLEVWNFSFDTDHFTIPLGAQFGIRLTPSVDFMFDYVMPEFIHENCDDGGCNMNHFVFYEVWGFGLSLFFHVPM